MVWKHLPTLSAPMPLQMVLDEILFEKAAGGEPVPLIRFYYSSGPWISAGISFRRASKLRESRLVQSYPSVPNCLRPTGGGCVLHGNDLMFTLIIPYRDQQKSAAVFETAEGSYRVIHEIVRMAFRGLGEEVDFYRDSDALPKGADCFEFPVESDLGSRGKKLAGGAQKRSRGILLHQESIVIPSGVYGERLKSSVLESLKKCLAIEIIEDAIDPDDYFLAAERVAAAPAQAQPEPETEVAEVI